MNNQPAIGIDFGTTNSVIAVYRDGKVEILANDQGNRETPSFVAFTETERLVGEGAVHQAHNNPENTIYGIKRLIGRQITDPEIQEDIKSSPFKVIQEKDFMEIEVQHKGKLVRLTPQRIAAAIFEKLKEIAENFLGVDVKNVVITCPAYFNNAQRQALMDAALIAGYHVSRMINEASAAAIAYKITDKNVLVFDFGGSTNVISVLKVTGKDSKVRTISDDLHLGGENFDNLLVSHFIEEFRRKFDQDISENKELLRNLKIHCERAKRILSSQTQATFQLEGTKLEGQITRARFEDLCHDLFEKSIKLVEKALKDCEMSKEEIDDVILVGGSSRIPKIQEMLQEFFDGKELLKSINPEECVAYGAAVQANFLQQNPKEFILQKSESPKMSEGEKNEIGIGIDIGASKIEIAVCYGDTAEIVSKRAFSESTPFCVAFNANERLFGNQAEDQFTFNPENTIFGRDVKRIIGLHVDELLFNENDVKIIEENDCLKFSVQYKGSKHNFSPEAVLLMAVSNVKSKIEAVLQQKITNAVITVPSMFNSSQRFAVKNAVLAAGIEVESILNDSTASAITYMIECHGRDDEKILIFDMGATSTDVAVAHLTGNSIEIKECGGKLSLGAENFKLLLLEHFKTEFEREKNVRIRDNGKLITRLSVACEKILKSLSFKVEASYIIEHFYYGEPYEMKMNRPTFEMICLDLFRNIEKLLMDVVKEQSTVEEIIFTGYGCEIPFVNLEVLKKFDLNSFNFYDSVAKGAAYFAARNLTKASQKLFDLEVKQITTREFTTHLENIESSIKVEQNTVLPIEIESVLAFHEGACLLNRKKTSNVTLKTNVNFDNLVKITCTTRENSLSLVDHQQFDEILVNQLKESEANLEKEQLEYKKKVNLTSELEKMCLEYKRRIKKADETKVKLTDFDKYKMLCATYETLEWLNECKSPTIDQLTHKIEEIKKLCEEKINPILLEEKKIQLKNICIDFQKKFESKECLLHENDLEKIKNSTQNVLDWLENSTVFHIDELNEKIKDLTKDRDFFDEKSNFLKMFEHANYLMTSKEFKEADSLFKHIFLNYFNHLDEDKKLEITMKRVTALMELKDFGECIPLFDIIKDIDDENLLEIHRKRGICHFELKNYEDCLKDLKIVLNNEPDPDLQKLHDEAIFQKSLKIVDEMFNEACRLAKNQLFSRSNLKLEELLLSPEYKSFTENENISFESRIYMLRAQNNMQLKCYRLVLEDCEIAEKDPENQERCLELQIESFIILGNFCEAKEKIELLESISPQRKHFLTKLKHDLEEKKFQKAKVEYADGFKNKNYNMALKALEQIDEENLERLLKPDFFCKQAEAYMKLVHYSECIECCQKALNVNKKYTKAFEIRAQCYYYMKEYQKAIEDCDVALQDGNCSSWVRDVKRDAEKALSEVPNNNNRKSQGHRKYPYKN
ncbi:uncharacterized protein LOC134832337 [Culicoides brevitarsis]|uniref:uncharacterized protein LOC134832337 n=1 Tax=Culicoides brevitarsis TaxID=469753 RepID=UPI00307B6C1C